MDRQSHLPNVESPSIDLNRRGERKWTVEERADILKMFNDGVSMGLIAEKYHARVGQISGIIYRARADGEMAIRAVQTQLRKLRMGIPSKPAKILKVAPTAGLDPRSMRLARRLSEAQFTEPKPHRVRLRLIDSDTEVTFEGLQHHHCRWPIGVVGQPDFRFCGCMRLENGPYCQTHADVAFRPATSGRRF